MNFIKRVTDGAAFLDTVNSEWKINPLSTDIGNQRVCALAQVKGVIYKDALQKTGISLDDAVRYGFQSGARFAVIYRLEYFVLSIVWKCYALTHPRHRTFKRVTT